MTDDSLEKLRKRLYKKRETFERRFEEPELTSPEDKIKTEWEGRSPERPSEGPPLEIPKPRRFSTMKIIFWGVSIFVLGMVILAAIYLFVGFGTISGRNIEITITAPEAVAGGDLVRWSILIHNRNDVELETADVRFYYPAGSRPLTELPREALIESRSLGDVPAGAIIRETFSAYVYGAEGFEGEARVVLEYRTEGSNAIFEKEERLPITISRSPIGVSIAIPEEINVGRELEFKVKYISNAEGVLNDLVLDTVYPPGFTFKSARPIPQEGNARWKLGDLSPGQERIVTITGIFEGKDKDTRSVQARVGILENQSLNVYGEALTVVTLRRLFLDLDATINGQASPTIRSGDTPSIEVSWRNNLEQAIQNATLEVELTGSAIDERFISVSQGFYRGVDKKVIWTPSSLTDLSVLNPGSTGRARFSFKVRDALALSREGLTNLTIDLKGTIKPAGAIFGLEGVDVSGQFETSLKLETALQLSNRALYYLTTLPGSGPLPPQVGQETVYTVIWSLANTSNDVRDLRIHSAVPPYVSWKGIVSPSGEVIEFDPAKSEINWRPGTLKAGVGITQPAREVMFQIGLIPSVDQVGSSPILLFDIATEGQDDFTGSQIRDTELSLTTDISRFDQGLKAGDGKVVQ